MSDVFESPLRELKEFEDLDRDLNRKKGPVLVSGCMDSQKVHLMYEAAKEVSWKLVVTYDDTRAREIYEDFRNFEPGVSLYPARDLLFFNADIHGNLLTKQRMAVFRRLMEEKSGVVVTTFDGLMDHLLPLAFLQKQILEVGSGQTLDIAEWKEKLVELGYERVAQVDGMGQFSIRGGIIDVFPPNQQQQVRIQLASVLECIVSQQLLKKADGSGRVAALEVLFANNAVRNLIRESKTYQIPSVMQTNKRGGMQTMDDALYDLFMRKVIDGDTAVTYAQDPVSMNKKVNLDAGSGFDTGFDGGFHAGFDGQRF